MWDKLLILKLIESITPPLFLLFSVLLISEYIKDRNLFGPIVKTLLEKVKNQKLLLFLFTNILGFLPVPGRIVLACGMLDSIQDKEKNNAKMGILAFLSTHHYYLWSPLEKSIIIVIGVAGISYIMFLKLLLPAIVTYAILLIITYFFWIKESDINLKVDYYSEEETSDKFMFWYNILSVVISLVIACLFKNYYLFFAIWCVSLLAVNYKQWLKSLKNIDYMILVYLAILLILTFYLKKYGTPYIKQYAQNTGILAVFVILSFIGSFILGSSSRYAMLTAVGVTLFGVKYIPLLYLVDFAGYFISPAHKCILISKSYFKVPVRYYYKVLITFITPIVVVGQFSYLIFR